MSRIGKLPIVIPAGVTVTVKDNVVTVKGPKGELSQSINPDLTIEQADGHLTARSLSRFDPQYGSGCERGLQERDGIGWCGLPCNINRTSS